MKKRIHLILMTATALIFVAWTSVFAAESNPHCISDKDCGIGGTCVTRKTSCPSHPESSTCAERICMSPEEISCRDKHGLWGGTEKGRGRLPGCTLPTNDDGKSCTTSDDCKSVCLSDNPDGGHCYGWKDYRGCNIITPDKKVICVD